MKKRKIYIILSILLTICACSLRVYEHTNGRAHERIISLKPNITEILYELGLSDKIVGVTTWCDWPEEAKSLPKVADYININTEKIILLKPDLVIGSEENSVKEPVRALQEAGINTLLLPFTTIDQLLSSIQKIADTTGLHEQGVALVNNIKKDLTNAPTYPSTMLGASQRTNARVLLLVGHRPLVAAGKNTFYNDILKNVGAKNIITGNTPYPTINTEFILANNPDIIFDLAMGSDIRTDLPAQLRSKVKRLDISEFRAGPRIGKAIAVLKSSLSR